MSKFLLWSLLAWATGSPVGSLLALLLLWGAADRFTFRLLPDPLRALARWRRRAALRRALAVNPREALTRLLHARPGTVQGRVLLAQALDGLGDAAGARLRDEAWREYAALPRFRRREERPWAWRIRPWRPALVAAVVVLAGALAAKAAPRAAPGPAARPPEAVDVGR